MFHLIKHRSRWTIRCGNHCVILQSTIVLIEGAVLCYMRIKISQTLLYQPRHDECILLLEKNWFSIHKSLCRMWPTLELWQNYYQLHITFHNPLLKCGWILISIKLNWILIFKLEEHNSLIHTNLVDKVK